MNDSIAQNGLDGQAIWAQALKNIKGQMTKTVFSSIFVGSEGELTGEGQFTVYANSEANRQWIENKWSRHVTRILQNIMDCNLKIIYSVKSPIYLPVEELLTQEPDDLAPDAEFEGVYHDRRNAITQPDKVEQHTQYFRKKWRPLLGPLLSELVRELRQRCHYKTGRNTFKTTYKSLAEALGVSEKTIKRALARGEDGAFKNEHLNRFISSIETVRVQASDGKIRNQGTRFAIYRDDPLIPEHQVQITEGTK